ncbi:MAG: LPS assembly protein LptD [Methylococcaceae bacterium]|nr:LPS assembly protein LptD [Methylococcaceae bacterium]
MLVRLYLFFLLSLFTSITFANDANWNCHQDKNTKEWVCVGSSAPNNGSVINEQESKKNNGLTSPEKSEVTPVATTATPKSEELIPNKPSRIDKEQANNPPIHADEAALKTTEEKIAPSPVISPAEPYVKRSESKPVVYELATPVLPATQKPQASAVYSAKEKLPVTQGNKPKGWNCDAKGKDGDWNCQLVGADPQGEAHAVETEDLGFRILDPSFDSKQELIFNSLRERFKTNPWASCTVQVGKQNLDTANKKLRAKADLDMNSNYSEIYDNEIGNYEGNVEMKRADQKASSNAANYDSVSETLDLHGNVYYSEDDLAIHTESASLKLASDEARLRETLFISPATPLRGKAEAVYRDSDTLSRYKGVAYTACVPGNQDWIVHANDLKMNKTSGYGSAKNAWVEFKGVPVFYSPYLSFPLDNRRLTGFLAPSFGNTQSGGFSFSAPFYWNIAPNYDATLRPRYYTKRGVMLAGDFRYLTKSSQGSVSAEYMPEDTTVSADDPIRSTSRYLASIKNKTQFSPHINSNVDLNLVSDKFYFAELGNALSFPNFSHVRSVADVSYIDQGISLIGRLENYQTIDPNLTGRLRPYRRLPQLNLNLNHTFDAIPSEIGINNEFVYFQHDKSSLVADSVPDSLRFNIEPYASLPWHNASAFVTPKLSFKYTQYLLDNVNPGQPDSVSRTVPIASIDSGMFFEKDVSLSGNSMLHTIEPRLFYLFIPKVSQSDIPIFDTSFYDFSFNSLFRENRFSGTDRVQDANQITPALTTRLVDSKTGLERLKLSIGDIFYFQDREVTAPLVRIGRRFLESRVETSSFSPLVGELSSQINEHFAVETGMQWDPERNDVVRGKAILHFVNNPGEIVNLGYLYRKNTLIQDTFDSKTNTQLASELDIDLASAQLLRSNTALIRSNDIIQSDVSFRWPVVNDWFAIGRWQYSLLYNQTQEGFLGLEKETCCWRFRIIGRRYVNNITAAANSPINQDTPANSQTGVFFQIEFKGLTGIGEKLDDFFSQSIYGYRKSE